MKEHTTLTARMVGFARNQKETIDVSISSNTAKMQHALLLNAKYPQHFH
jgi:hypothetical protein